jgi:hypothetical protein
MRALARGTRRSTQGTKRSSSQGDSSFLFSLTIKRRRLTDLTLFRLGPTSPKTTSLPVKIVTSTSGTPCTSLPTSPTSSAFTPNTPISSSRYRPHPQTPELQRSPSSHPSSPSFPSPALLLLNPTRYPGRIPTSTPAPSPITPSPPSRPFNARGLRERRPLLAVESTPIRPSTRRCRPDRWD